MNKPTRSTRCLRLTDAHQDLRCGRPEFDGVHDPLGFRLRLTDDPDVHPFDGWPPLCPEDEPPRFIEKRP